MCLYVDMSQVNNNETPINKLQRLCTENGTRESRYILLGKENEIDNYGWMRGQGMGESSQEEEGRGRQGRNIVKDSKKISGHLKGNMET